MYDNIQSVLTSEYLQQIGRFIRIYAYFCQCVSADEKEAAVKAVAVVFSGNCKRERRGEGSCCLDRPAEAGRWTCIAGRQLNVRIVLKDKEQTMAIDIEWQRRPPQKEEEEGKPLLYPRVGRREVVNCLQLSEKVAAYGKTSRGVVQKVLDDFVDVMAELLQEGKEIDLPGWGRFRLSIGTDMPVYPDTPMHRRSVVVRNVLFQPTPSFLTQVGTPVVCQVERKGTQKAAPVAELAGRLDVYFQTHDSMTSAEFARMFRLKRSTAHVRLQELLAMGVIRKTGSNRTTSYVKAADD